MIKGAMDEMLHKMMKVKGRMMWWSRMLGFLGLAGCGTGMNGVEKLEVVRRGKEIPELSVLFIGNSYSFGVPRAFARLARSRGKRVSVKQSTIGGWSLEQHRTQPETLKKLHSRHWDVVVIQDHSLHPGSDEETRLEVMDPAVRFFVEEARAMGAVPLLYQTWGRRDGYPPSQGGDFFEMNERVRKGCRNAAEAAGGVGIVPVGDAWERVFRAGRGTALFQEDGSHPSAQGDEVSAAAFYDALFGR